MNNSTPYEIKLNFMRPSMATGSLKGFGEIFLLGICINKH